MSNNPAELQDEKEKPQASSPQDSAEHHANQTAANQTEADQPETADVNVTSDPIESASTGSDSGGVTANESTEAISESSVTADQVTADEAAPDKAAPSDSTTAQETASDAAPSDSSAATESKSESGSPTDHSADSNPAAVEAPSQDDVVASSEPESSEPESSKPVSESQQSEAAPKPRVKIGSQRENRESDVTVPKAVKDAKETVVPIAKNQDAQPEPAPVGPSVQDLGDQWEKEAAEVLEGQGVNALMDSASDGADLDLAINTRIKGTVTKVFGDSVFFLLKGQYDGVLPAKQFKKEPEPGTMTDVVVTGFNADDSLYELSLPGAAVAVGDWSDLNVGNLIEVRITGSNTGGLECSVNNIRGFIPASQIDVSRVDNLGAYINQTMECVITEANKKKKNLVLSRRSVLEKALKERKKELLEEFEVGSIVEGKITKLREFGAFVNIGSGVEGLIHISKCSWHHIKHPSEVFEEGQDVSVRIEKINKETGKIQLSHRDTVEHPWKRINEKYPVDSTVKGVVSKIADFGAFVKVETGVEGLVHISEIDHQRVKSVAAALNEGQEVEAKILSIDPDKQKMSLSLKALLPVPVREEKKQEAKEEKVPPREMAVKKRNKPLRGGTGDGAGGDKFGLNW